VVGEGLLLLKEREELEWLRREVNLGGEAIERGEYDDYDETTTKDLVADIEARGTARLLALRNKKNGA
jgi:hypothetical protein